MFFRWPPSIPARPVRPSLRDPRFALLLVGQSAGWVCSWAAALVLWGFAAYHFGAGPAGISLTALSWSGPPVVLTAFTGGLTDRFGPRTMLIIGYTCSAATSLGMSVSGSLTSLDIMALACGAARSLCSPASSALPTRIVESDDLLAANSLLGVTTSIGQVAGPLAASVLMAATGFRIAFTADATMYLVGALVIHPAAVFSRCPEEPRNAGVNGHRDAPAYGLSWLRAATAGAVAVAREPGLRAIALARMGVIFTSGAFLVIEPLYTRHVLHQPSSQFALFEAATGIGAVVTGLAAPGHSPPSCRGPGRQKWLLTAGAASCGLAAALFTGTPWVPVAYLGALDLGVPVAPFSTRSRPQPCSGSPPREAGPGLGSDLNGRIHDGEPQHAGSGRTRCRRRPPAGPLLLAAVAVAAGAVRLLG